ncbi:MAG: hypothetical protein QXL77_01110 [Candidatus Bathyarchaeia archaeon]
MSTLSGETTSSALRYALLHVHPEPFREVRRIKGIKFMVEGVRYKIEKKIESVEDLIRFKYEQIFLNLPTPPRFKKEELFERIINSKLNQIKESKDLIEQLEKRKETSLHSFVKYIEKLVDRNLDNFYLHEADLFMRSNLPLSILAEKCMSIDTFHMFIKIVEKIVYRYELLPNLKSRRRRHLADNIETMKKELAPLIDQIDLLSLNETAFELYIKVWSAEDINEVVNPLFIDISKINKSYFEEYFLEYKRQLEITREYLFKASRKHYPELFTKKVGSENRDVADMLGTILLTV